MSNQLIELGCILLIAPIISVLKSVEDGFSEYEENCMTAMIIQVIASIVLTLIGIGASLNE